LFAVSPFPFPLFSFSVLISAGLDHCHQANGQDQWNITLMMFIEASRQLHRLVGALDAGNVSATPAEFIYSSRFKVGWDLTSH
jgi:hypothetical protein